MGFSLPAEPARDDEHLMNDALMLSDQDRADLDASRRFDARLCEGAEQAAGRCAQTAERLFLQPVTDGPRQEILGEGCWRIGRRTSLASNLAAARCSSRRYARAWRREAQPARRPAEWQTSCREPWVRRPRRQARRRSGRSSPILPRATAQSRSLVCAAPSEPRASYAAASLSRR